MKNRLPLLASLSPNKFLDVAQVFIHESTVKILTKRGGGRLDCSWSVTEHKAIKSLRNLFAKMLSSVGHKKLQTRFFLVQICWLPLKWLILRQNETRRTCLGLTSLPYWVFLPLHPESVRTVIQAYTDVITKFSGINRFPFAIPSHDTYGAPLHAARTDTPL